MGNNIGKTDVKRRIDKIDVKKDHKELIALYYRLELLYFVKALVYRDSSSEGK